MHLFVIQSTQKSVLKSIYDTFISDKNNISSYKIFKFNEICGKCFHLSTTNFVNYVILI